MRTVPGFTHLKRGGRQNDILGRTCPLHHSYHSAGTHWVSCWWAGSPSLLDRTKKHAHKCKESRGHQRPHRKTAELTSLPSLASHRGQGDTCLLFRQRSNHETGASSNLGRSTELNVKEPARYLLVFELVKDQLLPLQGGGLHGKGALWAQWSMEHTESQTLDSG